MGRPLLMVSSITYAIKGKDLLNKMGYKPSIERIPRHSADVGCGYGICIDGDEYYAKIQLERSGIRVLGIFEEENRNGVL